MAEAATAVAAACPRRVQLAGAPAEFPSKRLQPMVDSSPLLALADGGAALRARLDEDGFLFLRGALPAEDVLEARRVALAHLQASPGQPLAAEPNPAAVMRDGAGLPELPNMEGRNAVTHHPAVLRVLEGSALRRVASRALGLPDDSDAALRTLDQKWLRAVPRGVFTGVHADAVYMSRGSPRLLTTWVPLEPAATLELGALAVLRGSHRLPGFARLHATYCALDVEAEPGFQGSGWLSEDPWELDGLDPAAGWQTADFAAGDVVLFGLRTLHCSTANATGRARISCDVRWQPAAEPIDDRYVGTADEMAAKKAQRKQTGAYAPAAAGGSGTGAVVLGADQTPEPVVTMADLRRRWGV